MRLNKINDCYTWEKQNAKSRYGSTVRIREPLGHVSPFKLATMHPLGRTSKRRNNFMTTDSLYTR